MDGGRNEELSEFLARILSIIFPTLPVSSIRSLLNRLSTRFSRSAARRKRHSVIFFQIFESEDSLVFRPPPQIYENDQFSFRKNVLNINPGSGAINFQSSPFLNSSPMRLIRLFMKIIKNNNRLEEEESSWIDSLFVNFLKGKRRNSNRISLLLKSVKGHSSR